VLYECNKVTVARPTALVATALLTHTGRGLPITQLRNKVLQLRQMIVERGGFVASLKVSTLGPLFSSAVLLFIIYYNIIYFYY
jgi:glycerol-3-phosphate O-acyltransferase